MNRNLSMPAPARPRVPAGNHATGLLKLIALFFMFIDHSGKVLFRNNPDMRLLGRIAFPIYVWCMIVGFSRTRSVPRYLRRILVVGLISQPFYVLALDNEGHLGVLVQQVLAPLSAGFSLAGLGQVLHTVFLAKPNIFLTLLLGLAALWGIREKKWFSQIWAPAAAVILATVLNADYGWKGIVLFLLLYAAQDSRPAIAAVMVAFFLYWGTGYSVTSALFGIPIDLSALPDCLSLPLKAFMRLETYALLSLPFILIRFRRDIRNPIWLSYGMYPAHLVLLILLKWIMFR